MPNPNEISVTELNGLIGTPTCPAIVDISIDADFHDDPHLIPTALRHSHTDVAGLLRALSGKHAVIVCQKGMKLSQGMAAWLRSEGINAAYLEGGNYGWREVDETTRIPAANIPAKIEGQTRWVTGHRPKTDRVASLWLIRRFVDPSAKFLFVSPSEVPAVAERYGVTSLDETAATPTGQPAVSSFDTMLDTFELRTGALDRMATVIRAAHTNACDLAPEAAGLVALSVGLSRQYHDDMSLLEAGLTLCDALYRWARDGDGDDGRNRLAGPL
ncbi:MAG: chromate resistance protein ChrB domain-containing protein [Pseudomonadota bacterium]